MPEWTEARLQQLEGELTPDGMASALRERNCSPMPILSRRRKRMEINHFHLCRRLLTSGVHIWTRTETQCRENDDFSI